MEEEGNKTRQDPEAVNEFCENLLKGYPENGYVRFVVGVHHYGKANKDAAISEYKKAAKLLPKFPLPYYQIGVMYWQDGDYNQSITYLDEAMKADPDYAPAHFAKGRTYQSMSRFDAAIAQYKKAIEIIESKGTTNGEQLGKAYYNWGWILLNLSAPDNDQAIVVLTKAIRADAGYLDGYNQLGIAYKRRGKFKEAVNCYQEAIKHGDSSARIYFNLGVAHFRSGNSAEASAAFQKAISLDPNGQAGSLARQWLNNVK